MNYGLGMWLWGFVDLLICPGFSSSWGIQLNNCSKPVFHSSLSPACLFISTYEFKPNALTNWVQYFSGGRPLLHFFPIPSSSRWCSILSCLIMCPIITLSCFFY
uniref:Uncharacterized protein n=1 Tax=Cacopsylla melanoneura TaxID=428564 RepID=A0A8D8LH56_9HEMI